MQLSWTEGDHCTALWEDDCAVAHKYCTKLKCRQRMDLMGNIKRLRFMSTSSGGGNGERILYYAPNICLSLDQKSVIFGS